MAEEKHIHHSKWHNQSHYREVLQWGVSNGARHNWKCFLDYKKFKVCFLLLFSYIFDTSKCATNYIISLKVYWGFIGQKILKLWRQKRPFGPGWAAHITRIRSWTFRLLWCDLENIWSYWVFSKYDHIVLFWLKWQRVTPKSIANYIFDVKARDIHTECSKQFKWNLYFHVYGQSGPFWPVLKTALKFKYKFK